MPGGSAAIDVAPFGAGHRGRGPGSSAVLVAVTVHAGQSAAARVVHGAADRAVVCAAAAGPSRDERSASRRASDVRRHVTEACDRPQALAGNAGMRSCDKDDRASSTDRSTLLRIILLRCAAVRSTCCTRTSGSGARRVRWSSASCRSGWLTTPRICLAAAALLMWAADARSPGRRISRSRTSPGTAR